MLTVKGVNAAIGKNHPGKNHPGKYHQGKNHPGKNHRGKNHHTEKITQRAEKHPRHVGKNPQV